MFWAVFFMLGIRLCCFYIQPLDSTKKWWPLLHTIEMFALLIKTLHWSICSGPLDLGLQKQNSGLSHYIFSILVMWWLWLNMPMQWQQHLNRLFSCISRFMVHARFGSACAFERWVSYILLYEDLVRKQLLLPIISSLWVIEMAWDFFYICA
jgi:hypothetical protein